MRGILSRKALSNSALGEMASARSILGIDCANVVRPRASFTRVPMMSESEVVSPDLQTAVGGVRLRGGMQLAGALRAGAC